MTQLTYVYLAYSVAGVGLLSLSIWVITKSRSLIKRLKAIDQ